ncbi:HAMP domain-containing histidine kinase [Paenibacillus motobuensis]|uniref:sensor histidine kinase n=1 Tax=Paenibacillus TaxID=44249 RepID=UPI00203EE9F7|nr:MULTISPECIES: HAMP domain-containing sensor histidine kinase [Paenibacillus]MCM3042451.1 HAMP domain-containing histidine kinase [Paenibacillus lutimineralis]MCM3649555.1 HAMP domain-containing histidine kinase [Paenibacillus motobuensis]
MMRSLYVRVIFTFLLAVIVGLTAAYISTWMIFQKQVVAEIHEETMSVSNDLVDIYVQTANQGIEPLRSYVHALRDYSIRIISHDGDVLGLNAKNTKAEINVTPEEAKRVLGGETVVTTEEQVEVIGRPFELNGDAYALFVMPVDDNGFSLSNIMTTFLLVMFVVGSIIFLIASRYLVMPIRRMTNATEQMASGDFGIELNLSRKDELGTLARSFDHMARELKQIEQMRQDFVSNVSHEIQSPLTSITGFAKALRDGVVSSENQTRYLGIIADESERLSRLSSNLLQLASLESEHHPFDPVLYALDEQLRKVVVSLEPQWSSKHINFELDLPAVQIVADPDQLSQVWLNLLGNAIKFTPENGKVSIGLSSDANGIEVTVADSGIGISPEDAKYIFERFYKADRSRNRTCQGSGLGLAIVRKIVELHNGRISIADSSPGEGTVIKVILPMGDRNVSTA